MTAQFSFFEKSMQLPVKKEFSHNLSFLEAKNTKIFFLSNCGNVCVRNFFRSISETNTKTIHTSTAMGITIRNIAERKRNATPVPRKVKT